MSTTQDSQTTFKLNLCIFLSARARYFVSKPNGWPCISTRGGADYAHPIMVFTPSLESHRHACRHILETSKIWLSPWQWKINISILYNQVRNSTTYLTLIFKNVKCYFRINFTPLCRGCLRGSIIKPASAKNPHESPMSARTQSPDCWGAEL